MERGIWMYTKKIFDLGITQNESMFKNKKTKQYL